MQELSLNILDIVQNSIRAEASLTEITVIEDVLADVLEISIKDNGCGMSAEQLEKVKDPFFTTRTTRDVGLGVPLFKMAAEMSGGEFYIDSSEGVGTELKATFGYSNIDRMPLGDMCTTIGIIISMNTDRDFLYSYSYNGESFTLDTRELRETLGDIPLNNPDVAEWIKEYLLENTCAVKSQD